MKLLESKKLRLPKVFYVSDRSELMDLPVGVPFIYGDSSNEKFVIRLLEYEMLYQAAVKTGYPFDFSEILYDNGYKDLRTFSYSYGTYMEYKSDKYSRDVDPEDFEILDRTSESFKEYIKDNAAYVDIDVLKNLNVFPLWLTKIEDAINTNIHNFAHFNNNMYNKKLEGMYGGIELTSPNRNLIIIDISGSIPKAVSTTCLTLAKNLVESFYADLLITGSKSTLYLYEEMYKLNIETVYDENGMDNDQYFFKKIISADKKAYKTAIVFGDNDSPCRAWHNAYNKETSVISIEDGKKINKWEIDKLISFHTEGTKRIAAYGSWFEPKETERIENWVKYLK